MKEREEKVENKRQTIQKIKPLEENTIKRRVSIENGNAKERRSPIYVEAYHSGVEHRGM